MQNSLRLLFISLSLLGVGLENGKSGPPDLKTHSGVDIILRNTVPSTPNHLHATCVIGLRPHHSFQDCFSKVPRLLRKF